MKEQDLYNVNAELLAQIADVLLKKSEELKLLGNEPREEEPQEEPFGMQDAIERVKKTYSLGEVADILRVGKSTINNLIKSGEVKVLQIGSIYRISKPSFDKWLDGDGTDCEGI